LQYWATKFFTIPRRDTWDHSLVSLMLTYLVDEHSAVPAPIAWKYLIENFPPLAAEFLRLPPHRSRSHYQTQPFRHQLKTCCLSNAMHEQNINLPVCVSVTLSVNSPTPTGQTALWRLQVRPLYVCVSVTLSVNSPTPTGQTALWRLQVRPLYDAYRSDRSMDFFTVHSLKDADLRKDVPFGVSMMNNHI